jgi:hypothetical protein
LAWFQKVAFGEDFKKLLFLLKNVAMIEFEKKKRRKIGVFLQRLIESNELLEDEIVFPQTVVMKKPLRNAQLITYVML